MKQRVDYTQRRKSTLLKRLLLLITTATVLSTMVWGGPAHASNTPINIGMPRDELEGYFPNKAGVLLTPPSKNGPPSFYKSPIASNDMNYQLRQPTTIKVAMNLASSGIAVIYPDIGEPYRSVFSKIIEGIEDQVKTHVTSYAVGSEFNKQNLNNELHQQNVKVVIALGRHGLKVASELDSNINIIAGGVLSVPETDARALSVLSLAPDPALLFSHLKNLMPSAKRVFVIYDPRQNAWLIRLARAAAKQQGLDLVVQEAQDLKTAVRLYQDFLSNADPRKDALWLPQDATTVDEASILPLVLQEAWTRSIAVFSSNVSHVRRGALFSLYPDNIELGRNLAITALGTLNNGTTQPQRGMMPLKDVLIAVNVRTASHLGLSLSYKQQRTFSLIFPEP